MLSEGGGGAEHRPVYEKADREARGSCWCLSGLVRAAVIARPSNAASKRPLLLCSSAGREGGESFRVGCCVLAVGPGLRAVGRSCTP